MLFLNQIMAAWTDKVICQHCQKSMLRKNLKEHTVKTHGGAKEKYTSASNPDIRQLFQSPPTKKRVLSCDDDDIEEDILLNTRQYEVANCDTERASNPSSANRLAQSSDEEDNTNFGNSKPGVDTAVASSSDLTKHVTIEMFETLSKQVEELALGKYTPHSYNNCKPINK